MRMPDNIAIKKLAQSFARIDKNNEIKVKMNASGTKTKPSVKIPKSEKTIPKILGNLPVNFLFSIC